MLFFYLVPLQFYGLLAVPVAVMQFCVIAGIALVFFSWRTPTIALGTVLCCLSVLYKRKGSSVFLSFVGIYVVIGLIVAAVGSAMGGS